jgi:hypothetical protein
MTSGALADYCRERLPPEAQVFAGCRVDGAVLVDVYRKGYGVLDSYVYKPGCYNSGHIPTIAIAIEGNVMKITRASGGMRFGSVEDLNDPKSLEVLDDHLAEKY